MSKGKSSGFLSILVPAATVFISSGCIMILELVAGRLTARYLGSSLYTWTSVIGVVLAGITIGNYLGGRIADKFPAGKALSALFAISSAACVMVVVMNNLVGGFTFLWQFSLPVRVFGHVFVVFLIPSTLLGTISPVVAKMALDRGLPAGRTVGDIYAWGAAGSIAGTFLTGFWLIAAMGTIAIIWTIGACLLLMAIVYWARLWVLYIWAAVFVALMTMGMSPAGWAKDAGSACGLREKPEAGILYEDESQYSYIAVQQISSSPDKRRFILDNKKDHSRIIIGDIKDLQFTYSQIYAAVTHLLSRGKDKLSTLAIGGGGYVFPRYIEEVFPGSRVDVAEIDPAVTEAAIRAFGLERNTTINTVNMDGRNYVDMLLEKKRRGEQIPQYDFIYEDACNDYVVPYQLTTREFNDKIVQILSNDGVYMVNLIDVYDKGRFLGAMVNTLRQTFRNVCVFSKNSYRNTGGNFVVVAAGREINLENIDREEAVKDLDLWKLSSSDMEAVVKKANGIILTDDYVPVENLLVPVALEAARVSLAVRCCEQAEILRKQERWDECISRYKEAAGIDPAVTIEAYGEIGMILAEQGRWIEAVEAAKKAIEYNDKADVKRSMSITCQNISFALRGLGRNDEAAEYMQRAIKGYKEDLVRKPDSVEIVSRLGNALAESGNFGEAVEYFQRAVNMNRLDVKNYLTLAKALVMEKRYDEAIEHLREGIQFMLDRGQRDDAAKLRSALESVEKLKK
jgi:tetratricopeptide (TPR) repeat protein/predicted membrane-bound spermidine synthase